MSNKQEIFEKIILFIEEQAAISRDKITRTSRIEKDLKISGVDATELMVEFAKEFHVDVSKFMAADYFWGEPPPIGLAGRWFSPRLGQKKDLTIDHLVNAVLAGRLDEDVIRGS